MSQSPVLVNLHYLDSPAERASAAILRDLGTQIVPYEKDVNGFLMEASDMAKEHRAGETVTFFAGKGAIHVDIRDSGDCWIRATLSQGGEAMQVSGGVYRRVTPVHGIHSEIMEASSTNNNAITRTRRFQEKKDSMQEDLFHPFHASRELICELCRNFFEVGWVTGTGGSISIRHGDRIYMTPSGVQKERIKPDELYVLDIDGEHLHDPKAKPGWTPKLSDCSPLFLHAYRQRNAGAVLHSHAYSCNLVTTLFEGQTHFKISHQEMIKGIAGYGYNDELQIPIIENTAHEHELADSLGEAIAANPKAWAVLVRHHGIYVWGNTWEQAKRHSECLHYLFELAINMKTLNMDFNSAPLPIGVSRKRGYNETDMCACCSTDPNPNPSSSSTSTSSKRATTVRLNFASGYKHVVTDIEGTTTPITFVKDVLFPYASNNVKTFLEKTIGKDQTQADLKDILEMAKKDGKKASDLGDSNLISKYVQECIAADRKDPPLKALQGHMWEAAYNLGEIKSVVYADVDKCFGRLKAADTQISIYSSGSRHAQKLLFKHSDRGNLLNYISGYFDTKSAGPKREAGSYTEIALSLGCEGKDILFLTDILEEAIAAKEAGLDTIIVNRPGNADILVAHNFPVIDSFDAL